MRFLIPLSFIESLTAAILDGLGARVGYRVVSRGCRSGEVQSAYERPRRRNARCGDNAQRPKIGLHHRELVTAQLGKATALGGGQRLTIR
jgi:hypothetical protein